MVSDFYSSSTQTDDWKTKLTKHRDARYFSFLHRLFDAFSPGERLVLYVLSGIFALSALALLAGANSSVSVTVPSPGGSLTEGVVGTARFINPLLALSGPDKDLTMLVYSGLMRATPEGEFVPDLAERYEVSEDGTVYTFTLRDGLTFHDGTPLTSADVLFTVQHAQNPDVKSTRRADWEGVVAVAPDERTVVFTLPHAYAPFIDNTTLGILPKHLWESVRAEEFPFSPANTRPVGSGPYRVEDFDTNSTGAPVRYVLVPFKKFALGEPYLRKIEFVFFSNEEDLIRAFNQRKIDGIGGVPPSEVTNIDRKSVQIVRTPLPRTFGIFFNQNKNAALADASVRAALDRALDKQAIINDALEGYGALVEGPVPSSVWGDVAPATPKPFAEGVEKASETQSTEDAIQAAKAILERGGWKFEDGVWKKKTTTLSLQLATADEPSLARTAEMVAESWRALGVPVEVHVYPLSELNTIVLRPRNYDAVLFGEVVGRTLDLFSFWHSSQRNDPGLNLALYTNVSADDLLEEARRTTNWRERERTLEKFAQLVVDDQPAVFLYAPEFIYLVPEGLGGVKLGALSDPRERFLNVYEWYTDTERVWEIFTDKTEL